MSVRQKILRDPDTGAGSKRWVVDIDYEHPDGRRERVRKLSPVQTKRGAEEYERQLREAILMGKYGRRREVPTFEEWFNGRYWREWVIARRNKPSTVEGKRSVYEQHLKEVFGNKRVDEIGPGQVAAFRASLV